jgi:transposase InsO family protein
MSHEASFRPLTDKASFKFSKAGENMKYQPAAGRICCSIMHYVEWYNRSRPHSSLNRKTPYQAYTGLLPPAKMAA